MEARLRNQKDVTIIHVGGTLDIEHTQGFKTAILKNFSTKKIVFDMREAAFVGSTGLGAFLDTLRELAVRSSHGVKFVGVNNDFRRIFQNLEIHNLEIFDSEALALDSFSLPLTMDIVEG